MTNMCDELRGAIERAIPGAKADVDGADGHYRLTVRASAFAGKSMVDSHRLVYGAIRYLMDGNGAPVHAIDKLETLSA